MDLRVTPVNMVGANLAWLLFFAGGAAGCGDLDLGDAPFKCNAGKPKCPDGYECTKEICVREGTCPWPAVPGCPAPPPQAKFCHQLQFSSGASAALELRIGSVPLEAETSKCSPCKNIPAGDQKAQLFIKGKTTPETAETYFVKGGMAYMHIAKVDSQNKVLLQRVLIPTGTSCAEASPAW